MTTKAERKANKELASKGQPQPIKETIKEARAAATYGDALSNVMLEVPKSAQKTVSDGTDFLAKSITTQAHNWYQMGIILFGIKESVSDATFTRLTNEVWSRFGLKRTTIQNYIRNATVLKVACGEDQPHIDALLAVSGGQGLVEPGKDGKAPSLNGGWTAGIRKHPIKVGREWNEALDWAREVQVIAERDNDKEPFNIGIFAKALMRRFEVLLDGNKKTNGDLEFAVHHVVEAYRKLDTKSQPYAIAALEAIQDSTISVNEAGKRGSILFRDAQKTESAVKAATREATTQAHLDRMARTAKEKEQRRA